MNVVVRGVFLEKLLGGGRNRDSRLQGGIHVSVYMHINVCTMIVQNDNALGEHKILKEANATPHKKTLVVHLD